MPQHYTTKTLTTSARQYMKIWWSEQMRFETPSHLRRDVVWSSNERMCKTTLVFPLSPSFQRLHPMGRRRGTRTPTRIQVQIPRVHWVLSAVAWKKGISQPFFALILIVRWFHQYWSPRWESCRCSGNTCCCGSSGTQCTDQSPSAWCAHWHLRRRIVNQLFFRDIWFALFSTIVVI